MNRAERYAQLKNRIYAMSRHAAEKGDGVQADKLRKIGLDVVKIFRTDESNMSKECD